MSDRIFVDYRGEVVQFDSEKDLWVWLDHASASLKSIKRMVDKAQKNALKEETAYYEERWDKDGTPSIVRVTSKTKDEYGVHYWIVRQGRRQRVRASEVFSVTPENSTIFREISSLNLKTSEIRKTIDSRRKELVKFKEKAQKPAQTS